MLSLSEFNAGFQAVWRSVETDFNNGIIDYEADLQASTYYHLRRRFGDDQAAGFRILSNVQVGDESGFRPDLGLECRNPKRLWIVFEFKGIHKSWTAKSARRDIKVKMQYYRKSLGAERGYFCFTARRDFIEDIRTKFDRYAEWARGNDWLGIAEGFHDRDRKVVEPWSVRFV